MVYGLTHSEASNWAKSWPACRMFGHEYSGRSVIELREMYGEPVWCCQYGWRICYGIVEDGINAKMLIGCGGSLSLNGYGVDKTWVAYRRKPEEGTI